MFAKIFTKKYEISIDIFGLAYYILYFKEFKLKFLIVGLLAGLAFFLNITSLIVFGLTILFYFILDKKYILIKDNRLSMNKGLITQSLMVVAGFFIVLLFFLTKFFQPLFGDPANS